jgi:hypothetical protein
MRSYSVRRLTLKALRSAKSTQTTSRQSTSFQLSPAAERTIEMLGPYRCPKPKEVDWDVVDRPPVELENNSVYIGQWNSQNQKHGQGRLVFGDGSIIEA